MIYFAVVGWLACGILGAGFLNAYWRGKYPRLIYIHGRSDLLYELCAGMVCGPIALLATMTWCCERGWYGWTLNGSKTP